MISLRTYLQGDRKADVLSQLVQLLVEGIERSSLEVADGDSAALRIGTRQILADLETATPQEELLDRAKGAMDALKTHNEAVLASSQLQVAELRAKVKLLTAAITAVSSTSDKNIERLREIKGRLLSTIGAKEIYLLRTHLSQCLDGVLVEAERQRAESESAAARLNTIVRPPAISPGTAPATPAVDLITGLPVRSAAEEAIAQACQDEAPAFVVVMAINQVETLNRSYGDEFGDQVIRRFATFMREELPAIDQLFRWSGQTIVSLVRRANAQNVRFAIQPLLAKKLGCMMKTTSGDIHVPISARWIVLPLMASPRLLFHKIDAFTGAE